MPRGQCRGFFGSPRLKSWEVHGNFAIAWSNSLSFAVEKAGKTLIGSAASGEGFVNAYRGTGRVLMAPAAKGPGVPILR